MSSKSHLRPFIEGMARVMRDALQVDADAIVKLSADT